MIDDVGREEQGSLSKHRLPVRVVGGCRLGRRVDYDDFVGEVDEGLRHGFGGHAADDALHEVLLLRDIGKIHGRDHRDPCIEQFLDVLVPMAMRLPAGLS